jgi:MATE family multidrug resistance protein
LGYGIYGIWVGLAVGLAATAMLLLRRFEHRLGVLRADPKGAQA